MRRCSPRYCSSYFCPQRLGSGEGIEQIELLRVGKQRLMIVRAVQVHQTVAQFLEHRERGGAAIDELPVRARSGKYPLHDQLARFARLDPLFFQRRVQRGRDHATVNTASTAQLSAPVRISAFSARSPRMSFSAPTMMDLPGAGLAGDGREARRELPGSSSTRARLRIRREVERCEHGRIMKVCAVLFNPRAWQTSRSPFSAPELHRECR